MGDYHILMQFDIDAGRETVHSALATQADIASWWSNRSELTPERVLLVSFPGESQPFEFAVAPSETNRVEWVTGGSPP